MCLFVFLPGSAYADLVVMPDDLPGILQKISDYQRRYDKIPKRATKVTLSDGLINFLDKSDEVNLDSSFSDKAPTIIKHTRLNQGGDEYTFDSFLQNNNHPFKTFINEINGADALVFYSADEVFVYTQTVGDDGTIKLKEWIYVRKPNYAAGSHWQWIFKATSWQWPITLNMDKKGQASIYRNVPMAGMPIDIRARYNYMLQMMIKPIDNVKKYFPFQDLVATIPAPKFWTKEGVLKQADVKVSNISVVDTKRAKPKHGLDFAAWDDRWQSIMDVDVEAKPEEYPLLIDP